MLRSRTGMLNNCYFNSIWNRLGNNNSNNKNNNNNLIIVIIIITLFTSQWI